MLSYFSLFPEKCSTELRTVTNLGRQDLPIGTIVFQEYYCPDRNCNCERVLIQCDHVIDDSSAPRPYAMISFSWNDTPDASWKRILDDGNPMLDPSHINKKYATELMAFWYQMYLSDKKYRERIFRHYRELRAAVGDEYTTEDGTGLSREEEELLSGLIQRGSSLATSIADFSKNNRDRRKKLRNMQANRRKPK